MNSNGCTKCAPLASALADSAAQSSFPKSTSESTKANVVHSGWLSATCRQPKFQSRSFCNLCVRARRRRQAL